MKWNEIAIRIKTIRSQNGLGLSDFGKLVGHQKNTKKPISHVTIRNWESGSEIKKDNWDALVIAISKLKKETKQDSEEWLKTGATEYKINEKQADYNITTMPELKPIDNVPVISLVQAGDWTEAIEPYVSEHEENLPCPYPHSTSTFAVKITGQSMSPEFPEGMIIFIDPNEMPENKQYCIAKLTDTNQATFKQYVIEDGQKFLKATNPDWPTKYTAINGNCQIIGRLIGVYLKY